MIKMKENNNKTKEKEMRKMGLGQISAISDVNQ